MLDLIMQDCLRKIRALEAKDPKRPRFIGFPKRLPDETEFAWASRCYRDMLTWNAFAAEQVAQAGNA